MTAYANVNGETVIEGRLHIPNVGPWWADVVFEAAPDFDDGEAVTFALGAYELSGTVDPDHNGTFGEQRRMRILAGGGGWSTPIAPQHYHNDAGVLARAIVEDAARLVGETLGAFEPAADKVGIDYVRQSGPASRALEDAIGGAAWWVDESGATVVGARATFEAAADSYQVLESKPAERLATLAVDDLETIGIGAIFSEGLDAPLTAFELEVIVSPEAARVVVWGGGTARGRGRLAGVFESAVASIVGRQLFGKYRYRVVKMSVDRVELQAVASAAGLPDVLPVAQKPGVAGAHAKLTPGSIVLVEFIEGDRTLPLVVAFAGKGEEGHAPEELDFAVTTSLRLGSDAATEGVPLGDSLKSWLDGHTHTPGTFATVSGPVTGASGGPLTSSPSPSSKVTVDP